MSRQQSSIRRAICLAVALVGGWLATSAAQAWTAAVHLSVARHAAAISPADLGRQIARHREELQQGVMAACGTGAPTAALPATAERQLARTVEMIRAHRPFSEVVRQLGAVSCAVAAANDPLVGGEPASFGDDYELYVERALPRFAVVFYGPLPAPAERTELGALLGQAAERGRQFYPMITAEYARVGAAGSAAFDDKSTAFGVASVAHSRAVTDVALVFREIWLAAGGGDAREGSPDDDEKLFLLPGPEAVGRPPGGG